MGVDGVVMSACVSISRARLAADSTQKAWVTPTKYPRRGPNCGAPTPMPVPSRISYFLSSTLMTSNAGRQSLQPLAIEVVAHPQVDLVVVGQPVAVGDALPSGSTRSAPQSGPQQQIAADPRALPLVGSTARGRDLLLVIQVNVMIGNVSQIIGSEIELTGHDVLADGALDGEVGVGLEVAH